MMPAHSSLYPTQLAQLIQLPRFGGSAVVHLQGMGLKILKVLTRIIAIEIFVLCTSFYAQCQRVHDPVQHLHKFLINRTAVIAPTLTPGGFANVHRRSLLAAKVSPCRAWHGYYPASVLKTSHSGLCETSPNFRSGSNPKPCAG